MVGIRIRTCCDSISFVQLLAALSPEQITKIRQIGKTKKEITQKLDFLQKTVRKQLEKSRKESEAKLEKKTQSESDQRNLKNWNEFLD